MRCLSVLMLCWPLASAAQEAIVDQGAVETCFDQTGQGLEMPDCVGEAADICSKRHEQPETTLAISQCLMAENSAWDALLNREYKKSKAIFADTPGLADTLLTAQRAWIAFRDADCAVAYDQWGGGSMRVISAADCQLRHTARRTFQLREYQGN